MARRGRPKKPGRRFPGGQLKAETAGITVTSLQRLRSLGTLPMLETQVGRMLFLGELRPIDMDTAHRMAEIYGRYDRAMGRRRSAASPAYEAGRAGRGAFESEDAAARAAAAMRAYGDLQAELRLCPRGVRAPLEELCVEDRPCPPGWLPAVKAALDVLAGALGLRRRRRT